MVMVLTFAALDTAEKVDNWISGRADLQLRLSSGICCLLIGVLTDSDDGYLIGVQESTYHAETLK